MALRFPSPTNAFVPSWEATGLVIQFVRSPSRFKLNEYVQKRPTTKPVGLYLKLDGATPIRVVTDEEFAWEDGDELPLGNTNIAPFEYAEFRCYRRAYPWTLGWQTIKNASWQVRAAQSQIVMMQAMTNRTKRLMTILETAGTWGSNTATATDLNAGAGKWDTASDDPADPNYLAITKSINEAVRRIFLATNAMVAYEDLRLILSPGTAIAMSETPEIRNYLRESPFAMAQVRGEDRTARNNAWGLPNKYAGVELVVEDAPIVTTRQNAAMTASPAFIKGDDNAILVSRPGGIDGPEVGGPSFSTVQWFHFDGELRVKSFQDELNEREVGAVVEQYKEVVAAPQSGFLITDIRT